MGKSRLEQCQSTKELKYETILRPLCGNSSELLLFEFTGFLGHVLIYSSARSCWFSVIFDLYGFLGFLSSSIMRISGALQSSTVYLCAGGQRWQCLGGRRHVELPGWARQRGQSTWWWHLSDEIRCPGRPPVDAPAWWWELGRCSGSGGGRGATSFLNLFHGGKTWKNFRTSCEVYVLSQVEWHHSVRININCCAFKKGDTFCFENWKKMNSIDALSLVSLSPSHRLDAAGTWSSISIRYYLIFKDYSKSSIWHSIPTHACNALKDEYLIHSHVSHCLRMFIWVTWYIIIYWLTDWWLMRFDENCWQTVFRLKLKLASEHRTRTEPPYANLIKTLCTLSCKMCKSKLKQHCQILPAYKDMKLETTLSELSCFHSNSLDFSVMSWYSGTCSWHQLTMWCDADQLAQVDDVGNAWVAGGTHGAPWMGTPIAGR